MSVSVGFISLGCSKNLVDSQVMAGYLKAGHISLAASPETADVILVNTCSFIEAAREEARLFCDELVAESFGDERQSAAA